MILHFYPIIRASRAALLARLLSVVVQTIVLFPQHRKRGMHRFERSVSATETWSPRRSRARDIFRFAKQWPHKSVESGQVLAPRPDTIFSPQPRRRPANTGLSTGPWLSRRSINKFNALALISHSIPKLLASLNYR